MDEIALSGLDLQANSQSQQRVSPPDRFLSLKISLVTSTQRKAETSTKMSVLFHYDIV